MNCATASPLDVFLQKFWETEEIPFEIIYTPEEEQCENHFRQTQLRNATDRYIVRLLLRDNQSPVLGESYHLAQTLLQNGTTFTAQFRSCCRIS